MKHTMLLGPCLFALSLSSATAQVTVDVVGRVVDSHRRPIVGATVRLTGTIQGTYSTAADGRYVIKEVPAGDYSVTLSASGFARDSTTVHIDTYATYGIRPSVLQARPVGGTLDLEPFSDGYGPTAVRMYPTVWIEETENLPATGSRSVNDPLDGASPSPADDRNALPPTASEQFPTLR